MATYTNTSYVFKNLGTTANTLATVSSVTSAIASLIVTNTTVSPITANVFFTRSGTNYFLVYGATVPVGGSLEVIQGNRVVLLNGDVLQANTSANAAGDCIVSALLTN